MTNNVDLTIDDAGIATVTLTRPEKHNAFDDQIIAELTAIFTQVNNNPTARVMVLAAQGKSFSAGADLAWMFPHGAYRGRDQPRHGPSEGQGSWDARVRTMAGVGRGPLAISR